MLILGSKQQEKVSFLLYPDSNHSGSELSLQTYAGFLVDIIVFLHPESGPLSSEL